MIQLWARIKEIEGELFVSEGHHDTFTWEMCDYWGEKIRVERDRRHENWYLGEVSTGETFNFHKSWLDFDMFCVLLTGFDKAGMIEG